MPTSLRRLLGIPISFQEMFPGDAEPVGTLLRGCEETTPTTLPGWPSWLNAIRNAYLATFMWSTYSILKVEGQDPEVPYHMAYGNGWNWQIIPKVLCGSYVAVKHGKEHCLFATVGLVGSEIPFTVIGRGTKEQILEACRNDLVRKHENAEFLTDEGTKRFIAFV